MNEQEAQTLHDDLQSKDLDHDVCGCWCCCWTCDFDFKLIMAETTAQTSEKS